MACDRYLNFIIFFVLLPNLEAFSNAVEFIDSQVRPRRETGETKKFLIFPQGSNVQLIYCMTIGTYARPQKFFTMGVTAGLAWQLPHRNTVPYRKPAEVYHRRSRRELYHKIELMMKTQGRDGKACVLKAICKAGRRNSLEVGKGSFMQEILHSIFTLPEGSFDEDPKTEYERAYASTADCDELYPTCLQMI